ASGSIVNVASGGSDTPDPDPSDNSSTVDTDVIPPGGGSSADLSIVKTGPAQATAGSSVTYTLVVTNAGPDPVPDAVLDDPTPVGLAFVSASAPCAAGFPCTIGAIGVGASTTVSVTFQVDADSPATIRNVASVDSPSMTDPTPDNNSAAATTVTADGGGGGVVHRVPVDARWMLALMAALLSLV